MDFKIVVLLVCCYASLQVGIDHGRQTITDDLEEYMKYRGMVEYKGEELELIDTSAVSRYIWNNYLR